MILVKWNISRHILPVISNHKTYHPKINVNITITVLNREL